MREHAIGWRNYLGGFGKGRALAIALARGAGLLSAFPDDAIREHAVLLLAHRVRRGAESPVARPRAGFPYRSSSWREAAAELSAAWREIVFGRERG